jgi:hypothetical protein
MPLGGRQRKVLEPETAEWPKSLARFRTHLADALPQICTGGWLNDATKASSQRGLERVKGIEPSS